MTSTAHISPGPTPIASKILLPGDPLRAKHIAENFLEGAEQFNSIRNILGYTGTYRGTEVSVMGTGMGIPSMALYAYELIHFFGVKKLVRVGSIGAMQHSIKVRDLVIAQACSTDSNFLAQYGLPGTFTPIGDFHMIQAAMTKAASIGATTHVGNVLSSDIYYHANPSAEAAWEHFGVLGAEMETIGLYGTAAHAGVQALGLFTVSDHMLTGEETTAEARQESFNQMVEVGFAALLDSPDTAHTTRQETNRETK